MAEEKDWEKENAWDPGWDAEKQPDDQKIMQSVYKEYGLTKRQPKENFAHIRRMTKEQLPFLVGEIAEERVDLTPEEATEKIKARALELGVDLVGITRLEAGHVLKGRPIAGPWAVAIAIRMDFDRISRAPGPDAGVEATRVYAEVGEAVVKLAEFIRGMGYPARAHHPRSFEDRPNDVLNIPIAIKAGIGCLGRHGLIITRKFGPRVRLGAVSTMLEMVEDEVSDSGAIDTYCRKCTRCFRMCPAGAIAGKKSVEHGIEKFRTKGLMCAPYFAATDGCGICIKECDFNKPEDELEKMMAELESS
jgi:epoxyqueuosine reductase QueG